MSTPLDLTHFNGIEFCRLNSDHCDIWPYLSYRHDIKTQWANHLDCYHEAALVDGP